MTFAPVCVDSASTLRVVCPRRRCYICANRGKEVVREWRFPVRAVEVPAGRGVSPAPTGNRLASVGDDALCAARLTSLGPRLETPLLIHRWSPDKGVACDPLSFRGSQA